MTNIELAYKLVELLELQTKSLKETLDAGKEAFTDLNFAININMIYSIPGSSSKKLINLQFGEGYNLMDLMAQSMEDSNGFRDAIRIALLLNDIEND